MNGNELRAVRKKLGFTLKQMGEAVGLSLVYVSNLELGKHRISKTVELAVRYIVLTTLTSDDSTNVSSVREPEAWRSVVGFEGYYEVSSHGRVYSHHRGKYVATYVRKQDGYLYVKLCSVETGQKSVSVHSLVARAFLGEPPEGQEVSHEDGDRTNPYLGNLTYRTHIDNMSLCIEHGTKPIGEKVGKAVLTEPEVIRIKRRLIANGFSDYAGIADEFGVSKGAIQSISNGRTWKHVTV